MCQAEEFVNVTFPIADMDASASIAKKLRRLRQVIKPADAFLLFDRNPRRVDFLLQRRCPLELLSRPDLNRGQAEWDALSGQRQGRMHENAADRVRAHAAGFVAPAVHTLGDADRVRSRP